MDIQSLKHLLQDIRSAALSTKNPDHALGLASVYGYLLRINQIGVLSDDEFECRLASRLEALTPRLEAAPEIPRRGYLHIVTEAYDYGGHTPLLVNCLKARGENTDASVVVVQSATLRFENTMRDAAAGLEILGGSLSDKLSRLVEIGRHFETVLLHISPEDIVSSLAARALRAEGVRILLVNHADHVFAFGRMAASMILEVSGFGWNLTRGDNPGAVQSFLGIPLDTTSGIQSAKNPADRTGYILSVGSAAKYAPYLSYDFPRFLNQLVLSVPNRIVLIGPNGSEAWWAGLSEHAASQVEFWGMQSADAVQEAMSRASCYVDSFPMSGGTVFGQALLSGLPAHGLYLPMGGYTYADALRSQTITDLVTAITETICGTGSEKAQVDVRRIVEEKQGFESFSRRLLHAANGEQEALPAVLDHPEFDRRFFQNQFLESGKFGFAVPSWADISAAQRVRLLLSIIVRWRNMKLHQGRKALLKWLLLGDNRRRSRPQSLRTAGKHD